MRQTAVALLAAAVLAGCDGGYVLTAPDALAPAGGSADMIVRLQRRELAGYAGPVRDAAVRFRVGRGPLRAAYTDRLGYAVVSLSTPAQQGHHSVELAHMDRNGLEAFATAALYVWPADRQIVAVDLDALPRRRAELDAAGSVLNKLSQDAGIVYLTRRAARHEKAHGLLKADCLPDGPVLLWAGHGASPLPHLRKAFANFKLGLCDDDDAAEAFVAAGMDVIMVGDDKVRGSNVKYFESWRQLARRLGQQEGNTEHDRSSR